MRISMWILADWLEDLNPEIKISSTSYTLQNARLLQKNTTLKPFTVYVSRSDDNGTVCSNGQDIIRIPDAEPDFILNKILDAFEFYNDWEFELQKMIDDGCSLNELLGKGCSKFYKRLMVSDASFRAISCAANIQGEIIYTEKYDDLPLESLMQINALPQIRKKNVAPYPLPFTFDEGVECYNRNLFANDAHLGWLVDFEDKPLTQGQLHGLDIFGSFIERWFSNNEALEQGERQSRILLDILNDDYTDKTDLLKALNATGWSDTDEKYVYCFLPGLQQNRNADFVLEKSLSDICHEANIIRYNGRVYLIATTNLTNIRLLELQLILLLRKTGNVAGKSSAFFNIFDLRHFLDIANIAADYAQTNNVELANFDDAVIPYALHTLETHLAVDVCHPAIYKLIEYDRHNDAKLYDTLKIWLESERNYTKTAQELFIHRSTLLYRIDRIKEITELDFSSPELRFHIMLSIALFERRK